MFRVTSETLQSYEAVGLTLNFTLLGLQYKTVMIIPVYCNNCTYVSFWLRL